MGRKSARSASTGTTIARVAADASLVRVSRAITPRQHLEGVIVAAGIRWIVLHSISDDLHFDGLTAVRRKHIDAVEVLDQASLAVRALVGHEPDRALADDLDPTTTGTLLRTAGSAFDLVTLHPEERDRSIMWIGEVDGFDAKQVKVRVLDAEARWHLTPITVPFGVITRVDLGGRYERALARASRASVALRP